MKGGAVLLRYDFRLVVVEYPLCYQYEWPYLDGSQSTAPTNCEL